MAFKSENEVIHVPISHAAVPILLERSIQAFLIYRKKQDTKKKRGIASHSCSQYLVKFHFQTGMTCGLKIIGP